MKRFTSSVFLLGIGMAMLAGCTSVPQEGINSELENEPAILVSEPEVDPEVENFSGTDGYPWWNDIVFYEIFVRSFNDSDGDGIGDIQGMIDKLDYLNDGDPTTTTDLGITGIWLMPMHPSPSYHGYDVTNYYQINPDYGTVPKFREFLDEAHKRGIVVILDMVLNHTSSEHSWFTQGAAPDSEFHEYYIWSNTQASAPDWHTQDNGNSYYYGLFWGGMPDLNYRNPAVTEEMTKVSQFWLDKIGVDGFRLDAVRHLIEEGDVTANTTATHDWLKNYRLIYKEANPNAVVIGEIWDDSEDVAAYVQGDELDLAFNFSLAADYIEAAKFGKYLSLNFNFRNDIPVYSPNQFATFLSNHDQNRVMSQLNNNEGKAHVVASLLLTGPGVPFVYYGEEIGMVGTKPDPDIRTPMQWSNEEGAGFSDGTPWRTVNEDYLEKNVQAMNEMPDSLLNWYRNLIHLRNASPALRVGDVQILDSGNPGIYAVVRTSETQTILIVVNLTNEAISTYSLSLVRGALLDGEYAATSLLNSKEFEILTITDNKFSDYIPAVELAAYDTLVIELNK